jgi:hypothetical protein
MTQPMLKALRRARMGSRRSGRRPSRSSAIQGRLRDFSKRWPAPRFRLGPTRPTVYATGRTRPQPWRAWPVRPVRPVRPKTGRAGAANAAAESAILARAPMQQRDIIAGAGGRIGCGTQRSLRAHDRRADLLGEIANRIIAQVSITRGGGGLAMP